MAPVRYLKEFAKFARQMQLNPTMYSKSFMFVVMQINAKLDKKAKQLKLFLSRCQPTPRAINLPERICSQSFANATYAVTSPETLNARYKYVLSSITQTSGVLFYYNFLLLRTNL